MQLIKVPQSDFSCAEDAAAGTSPWVYAGLAPAILLFFVVAGFLLHRLQLSRGLCEISQLPDKAPRIFDDKTAVGHNILIFRKFREVPLTPLFRYWRTKPWNISILLHSRDSNQPKKRLSRTFSGDKRCWNKSCKIKISSFIYAQFIRGFCNMIIFKIISNYICLKLIHTEMI